MAKAALYCRVSTQENQSYDRQVADLKQIAIKDGYREKDIDVYAENESGFKRERNELNKLLGKVNENPKYYSLIYCTELSRIGRNPSHTRRIIDDLTELGVPIFIANQNQKTIDASGRRNAMLNIALQVLMEYANQETIIFKERSASGRLEAARKGKYAIGSNMFPYGYTKNANGEMVIDEEEAEWVKKMYKWYIEGKGATTIVNLLHSNNVPTRLNKVKGNDVVNFKKPKAGNQIKWSDVVVEGILTNTIYYGVRKFMKKEIDLPQLAIISRETYNEAQQVRKTKSHQNYLTKNPYLLQHKISCGVCGRLFASRYNGKQIGKDKVYRCSGSLIKTPCGNHSINIDLLESILLDVITKKSNLPLGNLLTLSGINENITSEIENLNLQLETINKELNEAKEAKDRLAEAFIDGLITREQMKVKKEKVDKSIKNIQERYDVVSLKLKSKKKVIADTKIKNEKINAKTDREKLKQIFHQTYQKLFLIKYDVKHLFVFQELFEDNFIVYLIDRNVVRNTAAKKRFVYKELLSTPKHSYYPKFKEDKLVDASKLWNEFQKLDWVIVDESNMMVME